MTNAEAAEAGERATLVARLQAQQRAGQRPPALDLYACVCGRWTVTVLLDDPAIRCQACGRPLTAPERVDAKAQEAQEAQG